MLLLKSVNKVHFICSFCVSFRSYSVHLQTETEQEPRTLPYLRPETQRWTGQNKGHASANHIEITTKVWEIFIPRAFR